MVRFYYPRLSGQTLHKLIIFLVVLSLLGGWAWDRHGLKKSAESNAAQPNKYVYLQGDQSLYLNFDERPAVGTTPTPETTKTEKIASGDIEIDKDFAWANPSMPLDVALGVGLGSQTASAKQNKAVAAERSPLLYYIYRYGTDRATNVHTEYLRELNINTGRIATIREISFQMTVFNNVDPNAKGFNSVRMNPVHNVLALSTTADAPGSHASGVNKIMLVDPSKPASQDVEIISRASYVQSMLWTKDGSTLYFLSIENGNLQAYKYEYLSRTLTSIPLFGDNNLQNGPWWSEAINYHYYANQDNSLSQDQSKITFRLTGRSRNEPNNWRADVYSPCTITISTGEVRCIKHTDAPNSRMQNTLLFGNTFVGMTITGDAISGGGPWGRFWMATLDAQNHNATEYKDTTRPVSDFAASLDGNRFVLHASIYVQDTPPIPGEFDEYRVWNREANTVEKVKVFPASSAPGYTKLIGFNGSGNNFIVSYGNNEFWNYNIPTKTWKKISRTN